jgi:hypothetical protein
MTAPDIVDRLREAESGIKLEAADEIERLHAREHKLETLIVERERNYAFAGRAGIDKPLLETGQAARRSAD